MLGDLRVRYGIGLASYPQWICPSHPQQAFSLFADGLPRCRISRNDVVEPLTFRIVSYIVVGAFARTDFSARSMITANMQLYAILIFCVIQEV
jgi:hypothetical protein